MEMTPKDGDDRKLEDGFYVAISPVGWNDIYYIKVCGDTFSVENWEGFLKITDYSDAAKNFHRMDNPTTNVRFVLSKLEQL